MNHVIMLFSALTRSFGRLQPLRAKGWDRALVEFTVAMLTNSESEPKQPLAKRLHEISCPGNDTKPVFHG